MKFPNSPHAEGWMSHFDNAEPGRTTAASDAGVSRPKPKIGIRPQGPGRRLKPSEIRFDSAEAGTAAGLSDTTAMPGATVRPTASASAASVQRNSPNTTPWLIGAGVGVALIAGAVVMSRHSASVNAPDSTPIVTGQASTQPATPSAEDQQLAAAPSGAGTDTGTTTPAEPAATTTAAATPAVTPEPTPPTPEPAAKVAEAKPAPMFTKATPAPDAEPRVTPKVESPAPQAVAKAPTQPAPVIRTLTPPPAETVAQAPASLPPATLTDPAPAQAAQPMAQATPMTPANPAVPAAQPTTPPVTTAGVAPATTAPVNPAVTPTPAPTTPATTADANTANPVTAPIAQATPTPTPAATEDAGITVKVRSALVADSMLSGVPISVSTNNGVVKLEGQAPDAQAREHATAVVASTIGVKGVDNRLTVPPVAQANLQPATQGS